MATVAPRNNRKFICDLALIVLTLLFQLSTTIMSFTLVTTRTRRLVQTALQDARSGFSKRPHEALSSMAGAVAQPQLSVEEFQIGLQNQLILAPLTRGGNLPFRRLCATFNSNFTMSEMAYARNLFKGYHKAQKKERALAKKGPTEKYFGFQIATKSSDEALRAAELAVKEGATWIDLNCGCPIYEATRRGLGAAMLKRPSSLEKLVGLTVASTPLPMTVKIRLGVSDSKINAHQVVEGLVKAGVAAVTIHGRTMEQRYTRPADWNIISDIAKTAGVPIIGNGDILTWFEAEDRMQDSNNGIPNQLDSATGLRTGVTALMAGRGALIKPWIFKEWAEKKSWFPTAEERVAVYWELAANFKEHFGADEHGKRHTFYFLPWHFEFFCRYRPLPDEPFRELSRNIPLIQNSRSIDEKLIEIGLLSGRGEPVENRNKLLDSPLERLLRCEVSECHMAISEALWAANTSEEAVDALLMMAHSRIAEFELQQQQGSTSSFSVRGKGVQRNNGESDEGRGRGRSDESSWEMGGSGPRGKVSSENDEGSNEDEIEDLTEDNTESHGDEEVADSDTNSIRVKRAEKPPSAVRSNPQGRVGGRGSSGISPAEMALSFVELRVGKVISVSPHPDPQALNLVVTTVDLGPAVGIRTAVTAERLIAGNMTGMNSIVGKHVVVLCNLKERAFLGITSGAMLLFSTDESSEFCPLYAPSEAPVGAIVSFPGYASKPTDSFNKASKSWKQLESDCSFIVNKEGVACFDPRPVASRDRSDRNEEESSEGNKKKSLAPVPFCIYIDYPSKDSKETAARPSERLFCTSTVSGRIL